MKRRGMVSAVGVLSVLVLGLQVAPVSSTVLKGEPFPDPEPYMYSDCGYPIRVEFPEFEGTSSIRVGKNKAETAFFAHESIAFREVHTNTVTGEWFAVSGKYNFLEVKATQVEGTVYEFTQIQSGQPFVVQDSTGRVVLRDRGTLRFHVVFDTGGDSQPGGEFVDFLGVEVRGPHPGFNSEFCRVAGDLVGISDSSQRYTLHPDQTTDSPLGYAEYLPPSYQDGKSPLLVFLHGSGESGDGSAEQLGNLAWQAIPKYIANDGWPNEHPFVVLAPQHQDTGNQADYSECDVVQDYPGSCYLTRQHTLEHPTPGSICFTPDEIHDFITFAVSTYDVDPNQVYLTGISCGAFGAWEYLAEYGNEQVAAAVPIAGEGRPAWDLAGCDLGEVALWAFHGMADDVVSPAGSVATLHNVQACPSPPRRDALLTTYPDADHDSWTPTYTVGAADDIYTWMLGTSLA